jgi:hypothetical protein
MSNYPDDMTDEQRMAALGKRNAEIDAQFGRDPSYVASLDGLIGPRDDRHPLAKLFSQAIRNGHSVAIITEHGTTRFNSECGG